MGSDPKELGRYRLGARIAAGGMAEVYRAKYVGAAGVTKSVVIKRILPAYAGNPTFVRMFVNEAKIAASLSHGNIAQVFDFGEIDGEFFLAMELVHGQSLSKIQRRAREKGLAIPIPISVYLAMEVAKGLHYAHTRTDDDGQPLHIVHRDVSPQNVLVSYEGQVKVVDFGIAKARDASSDTEAGAVKGKYLYFSPEQARGRALDARSDVFSLGIVLYELLTGVRPFQGRVVEVLGRIVKGEFAPPRTVDPEIPPELERIVLKAMAHGVGDRFGSALELQEALAAFLYGYDARFTGQQLAHFVQYLFTEDLAAEGPPPKIPAAFLEQLARWRARPAPAGPVDEPTSAETRAERISSKEQQAARSRPGTSPHTARVASSRRTLAIAGGAAGAGLLLALAAFGAVRLLAPPPGAGTVAIESDPPGATVTVDGQLRGATPLVVEGLRPGVPYAIELEQVGRRPWRGQVVASAEGPVRLEPTPVLELLGPAGPAPPGLAELLASLAAGGPPPSPEAIARASARAAAGALAPGAETVLELAAPRDAIDLTHTAAARVEELSPARTYRLRVEGEGRLGPSPGPLARAVGFVVERAPGAAVAGPAAGVIGPGARVEIAGARRIFAFVLDDEASDNAGAVILVVEDAATGERIVRSVHLRDNAVGPRALGAPGVRPLSPLVEHEIAVEAAPGEAPAGIFVGRAPPPGRVQQAQGDLATTFVPAGGSTRVLLADGVSLALLAPAPATPAPLRVRVRALRAVPFEELAAQADGRR